jgi:hypothetical protein
MLTCACRPTTPPTPEPVRELASPTNPVATRLGVAMPTHPAGISALAVAGDTVVAATEPPIELEGHVFGEVDPGVRVWRGGHERAHFGDSPVIAVAITSDAQTIATADVQHRVQIRRIDGTLLGGASGTAAVLALGWDDHGDLVVVRRDGTIAHLDRSAKESRPALALGHEILTAALGSTRVVVGRSNGEISWIDHLTPAAALRAKKLSEQAIVALALAPDEKSVAAGDEGGELWRFALGATDAVQLAPDSGWPPRALAITAEGHVVVATTTQGQYLSVIPAAQQPTVLLPAADGPYAALVVADGVLWAGSNGGIVRSFDLARAREVQTGPRHVSAPRAMAFDGDTLVSYAHPEPLRWDVTTGDARPLRAPQIWPLAITPGGARAIVFESDGPGWAWHEVDSDRTGAWHDHARATELHVAFAGDVLGLAYTFGMQGEQTMAFELRRGEGVVASWRATDHPGARGWVAADGGASWASLDFDGRIHVWKSDGSRVCRTEPRLNPTMVFGRDASELVVSSESDGLEIVDAARCAPLAQLREGDGARPQGTTDAAHALASAPNHGVFASGHGSGTVILWSLRDRKALWSRQEQRQLVEALVFDPRERRLASAARDGSIVVWRW